MRFSWQRLARTHEALSSIPQHGTNWERWVLACNPRTSEVEEEGSV